MTPNLIIDICLELGISKEAGIIYNYLIKNQTHNITKISKATQLLRQKVYSCLEELNLHKLIILQKEGQKYSNDFIVNKPSVLLSLLRLKKIQMEKKESELESNLVWFGNHFTGKNISQIVKISSKNDFIKEFVKSYSDSGEDILFCGSTASFADVVGLEVINLVTEQRQKNRVQHRIITNDSLLKGINNKKLGREVRYYKNANIFNSISYSVIGNKTLFWNFIEPCCYMIEDEFLSKMMRFQFELLWSVAEIDG